MDFILYQEGYKYQLVKDYVHLLNCTLPKAVGNNWIILSQHGTLILKAGYAWDGPSGPTIDTKNFMRGSLVHDALYQLMRESYLPQDFRAVADKALYEICKRDGMWGLRAWFVYAGVRAFGKHFATPMPNHVIRAP